MSESMAPATLCEQYVEQVPVSGASITVFRQPGVQSTICVSDELAGELDQLQFDLGEGPRWETARTGRASMSTNVRKDAHPAWPIFGAAAAKLGVGAIFSFPIRLGTHLVGVADLYRQVAGPLGDDSTARAFTISHRVAGDAAERASRSAAAATEEMGGAPALRREVHQATGMILMQLQIGASEAFALLQAHAFTHGRTVEDVASDVIRRQLDFRDLS